MKDTNLIFKEQIHIREGLIFLYERVRNLNQLLTIIEKYNPKEKNIKLHISNLSRFLRGKTSLKEDKLHLLKRVIIEEISPALIVNQNLDIKMTKNKNYYSIRPLLANPDRLELLIFIISQKYGLYHQYDAILSNAPDGAIFAYAMSKELKIPFKWIDYQKHLAFHTDYLASEIRFEENELVSEIYIPRDFLDSFNNFLIVIDYIRTGKTLWGMIDLINQVKGNVKAIIPIFVEGDHEDIAQNFNYWPIFKLE